MGDETVVDLWGGYQDPDCSQPRLDDTLVNVYSTTKGIASATPATVVEDGALDYDAPVKDYWPELRADADGLAVGQLLLHLRAFAPPRSGDRRDRYDWPRSLPPRRFAGKGVLPQNGKQFSPKSLNHEQTRRPHRHVLLHWCPRL